MFMRKHIQKITAFLTGLLFVLNMGTVISYAQETEAIVTTAESESTTRIITTGTTPPWKWKTQTSTETTSAETSTETSYIRTTPFAVMTITDAPETISAGEEKIALFNMIFVSKVDLESDNPYLTAELSEDADLNSSISTDNKIIIRCAENAPAGKAVITYTYRHRMTGETGTGTIELNILSSEPQTVPASSETTSTTTVTTSTTITACSGDANGDGQIDILDIITMNKAILGKETLSETQLKAIDFNGNGRPDSEDSLTLMKYIVRLIDTLTE